MSEYVGLSDKEIDEKIDREMQEYLEKEERKKQREFNKAYKTLKARG